MKLKKLYIKYEEIIKYLIIGVLTTIISIASYYLFTALFLNPNNTLQLQIANILSWTIGVLFAYVTNRVFVFKSKNSNIKVEFIKFISSRVSTLIFDMLFMHITVISLGFNDRIIKIISNVFVIILNYILSKLFVFKKIKNN